MLAGRTEQSILSKVSEARDEPLDAPCSRPGAERQIKRKKQHAQSKPGWGNYFEFEERRMPARALPAIDETMKQEKIMP